MPDASAPTACGTPHDCTAATSYRRRNKSSRRCHGRGALTDDEGGASVRVQLELPCYRTSCSRATKGVSGHRLQMGSIPRVRCSPAAGAAGCLYGSEPGRHAVIERHEGYNCGIFRPRLAHDCAWRGRKEAVGVQRDGCARSRIGIKFTGERSQQAVALS